MSNETKEASGKAVEPLLPQPLQDALDKSTSVWRRLPLSMKLFLGAIVLTGLSVAAYMSFEPMLRDDAILFAQLEQDDAAMIVEKLKTLNVPYELTGDGTTIRVPEKRVHELRLTLAAEGIPRGGQVGFESFENMRLGATEFEQHVTYRRAMEGELARTISTVGAVRSARVHLVLPRKSVFAQKREAATASVVVKLSNKLTGEEVAGIVNLVGSAVPGLEPEAITLVTTDGTMLHRARAAAGTEDGMGGVADADQLAQRRALEALLEERTRTMLERVLGAGHVDVRVSAELDTAKVETKSDHFDKDKAAMRSEQAMEERGGGAKGDNTVAGVPGAEANLPGGEAIVGEAGEQNNGAGVVRKSHTRNFEVDRVQERRVSVTQDVKRLAVAVIIDGKKANPDAPVVARTDEELAKLEKLVKSAVGFDTKRGDEVTVASVPFFIESLPDATPTEHGLLPVPDAYKPLVDKWTPLAQVAGLGLLGLIAFLWTRRRVRNVVKAHNERTKKLEAAAEARALLEAGNQVNVGALDAESSTGDAAGSLEPKKVDYRVEALGRAKADPATAAVVLRSWLSAEAVSSDKAA